MGWDIFVELSETCSTEGMRVFALIGTFDDVTNGMFAKKTISGDRNDVSL